MLKFPSQTVTQRGFSMLETLIALVVFSVGLLGTAALQTVSKKATYDSVQRTTAAMLASDLLERMRANPTVLDDYLGVLTVMPTAMPATDCAAVQCDPDEIATYDLWSFGRLLSGAAETTGTASSGGLMDPTLCVAGPADGSAGFYEVAVAWRGRSNLPNRSAHLCGTGRYGTEEAERRLLTFLTFLDTR